MEKSEDKRPIAEQVASSLVGKLKIHITRNRGQFLRDEDGLLHVILEGRRIPINDNRNNEGMIRLMLEVCKVGTISMSSRLAIQRLQVHAGQMAGKMSFRKFSALSKDGDRLYIPIEGGEVLIITADEIRPIVNGEKKDSFWLEHPNDEPFRYSDEAPEAGLELFERLLVETQSCRIPEMKWLVAMHEGLFPYIRDGFPARLLLVHQGATQQGKTSGAQRFTLLHGLGQVIGDYSIASLGNAGDMGLMVLDNREQKNFNQPLIDFCLFLATGGERARSFTDGRLRVSRHRPVGVITTIEGVWKQELEARCVTVEYAVNGDKTRRGPIESEIQQRRHEIISSLTKVLQRYFQVRGQASTPNPIQEFEEHFTALCDLLRAFGEVAGKSEAWAEKIIEKWDEVISNRGENEEDELEQPLLRLFEENPMRFDFDVKDIPFKGKSGKLYITTSAELLSMLQRLRMYDRTFPKTANGLSSRLRSAKFRAFRYLDWESAPELEQLRRTAKKRPIGFFVENDSQPEYDAVTTNDVNEVELRHSLIC